MSQENETASDFLKQRTNEATNTIINAPLFADWSHASIQIYSFPPGYPPEPVTLPHTTSTKTGIVVMCIPSLLQPSQLRGISSSIHCWTKSSTESTANPQQEIAKAIVQQYDSCIHNIKIIARVNPSINDFKTSFTNQNINSDNRILFHYSQYGAVDITSHSLVIHSADKSSYDQYPIENVLNATAGCSVHVIDCDNAGILLPTYESFVNSKNLENVKTDIMAFFACGANEKLPRSPGLPFDLFTSCITTPARTALLWHSRHYYCFKNGPLHPLSIDFFEDASPTILNEITLTLHRLVEAMACEIFPPELFLQVFHSDSTIAHFAANFYLASRIFSFFGVSPLSFPTLPDLRKHQLWHSFDLRLDVALLQLNSPSPSPSLTYTSYLEQSLQTLRHLMGVATKDISFPSQLTQLPPALTSPTLQVDACEVIALYIDKSVNAIRQLLYFPILFPLFQLLPQRIGGENLIFSIAKILCFMPTTRDVLNVLSKNVLEELIFPLFSEEKPLFALIVATHVTRENPPIIASLNNHWSEIVLPLLKRPHQDVKIWTLLFISSFIESVDDYKVALVPILSLLHDDSHEVRLVALYTLCCFAGRNLDSKITPSICKLCNDVNPIVRLQLLSTITFFEKDNYIEDALRVFQSDPYPDIHHALSDLTTNFVSKKRTFIFEWYASSVLSPVSRLLTEPKLISSEIQPLTVKLFKHEAPNLPKAVFQKVTTGPTIACDIPITTNFANTDTGQFVFGTKNGEIAMCVWGEQQKPRAGRITGSQLTHVQYITNNNFPLTLASNIDGFIYALQFNGNDLKLASCFKATDGPCEFECDRFGHKLYTVTDEKALIYDLTKEKMVGNIISAYGRVRKIHDIPTMKDVVLVCGEKFELFDTRAGCRSVVTFEGPPVFDAGCLDETQGAGNMFALGHDFGAVSLIDARVLEPVKCYQIAPENLQTLSFAVQKEAATAAIGNVKGVFMADLISGKKLEFTMVSQLFFTSKKIQPVKQCIFHNRRFRLSLLQEPNEIMTLVEDL
ncbi:hypothetical protein TRFO_07577 [Tritrichomonas foetus]|uniref:Raptor N-terminal CASPase-like domain-containing protein n=1 Tax=Tritrichomonas foetus TaxID=1144522 RepID=A0A1J4JQF2_9EUKA|nr:hypothetical protein TRFO_07577 [Tritrichomonas foetus]|eukprot:OHT01345.1 hypothetical protein TRFO_07577 [Tritrichomonas foetus]